MVRTIIWVVLTVILVVFSMVNWDPVTIKIWPGNWAETKLPVLILISYLLGVVPMWIAHRASRWSLKRRLDNSERQLADLRAMANRTQETMAASTAPAPPPTSTISPSPLEAP